VRNVRRQILEITIRRKLRTTCSVIWIAFLTPLSMLARMIHDASSIEKYQRVLIRFLKASRESGKDAIHRPRPSVHKFVNAKTLAILSIIICALLATSVYASMGPSAWRDELKTVMEMLSFANNDGSHSPPTARDSTPPTISGITDIVAEAVGHLTIVELTAPTVTDDLDSTPTVTNDAPSDGYSLGTNLITWMAKDDAENISTAVQKVTLVDSTPPLMTAPPDVAIRVSTSTDHMQASLGTAIVEDTVDDSPYVTNDAPFYGFPVGVTTVTWKAVDASGNSVTDTQLVSILVIAPATSSGMHGGASPPPASDRSTPEPVALPAGSGSL